MTSERGKRKPGLGRGTLPPRALALTLTLSGSFVSPSYGTSGTWRRRFDAPGKHPAPYVAETAERVALGA